MNLLRGDTVMCPLCGKPQEDRVEDYVVPGCVGESSEREADCQDCGAYFTVSCTAPGQYEVLAV